MLSVSFSISPSCLKCWTGFDNFALAPLCPVKLILLSVELSKVPSVPRWSLVFKAVLLLPISPVKVA